MTCTAFACLGLPTKSSALGSQRERPLQEVPEESKECLQASARALDDHMFAYFRVCKVVDCSNKNEGLFGHAGDLVNTKAFSEGLYVSQDADPAASRVRKMS